MRSLDFSLSPDAAAGKSRPGNCVHLEPVMPRGVNKFSLAYSWIFLPVARSMIEGKSLRGSAIVLPFFTWPALYGSAEYKFNRIFTGSHLDFAVSWISIRNIFIPFHTSGHGQQMLYGYLGT